MQTQPAEDIDVVLGRFQAWAGSRNVVETKPGIRELSYEEALRSRRYRWKAADKTSAKKNPGPKPEAVAVAASNAAAGPRPERGKAAPVTRWATKKVRAKNHAAKAAPIAKAAPAMKAAPAAKNETEAVPEFREALANAVRPTEVIVAVQPTELARQVAISIRLAPAERALIKTRAAQAGISASAYIRQCALEVEQLRMQVQQTLAAMERNPPVSSPVAAPGFFARLTQRIFMRRAAVLALRV